MLKPGIAMMGLGLLVELPLSLGSLSVGPVTFSLYWQMLGVTLSVLGLQSFFFGCLAQVFCDYTDHSRQRWTAVFRYTPTVLTSAAIVLLGLGLVGALLVHYVIAGYTLPNASATLDHLAVTGILLIIAGFSLFCFTLMLYAAGVWHRNPGADSGSADGRR
jgi:hypothetical protein